LKILIDECLPLDLVGWLDHHDVMTVQQAGWAGVKNGLLLSRAVLQRIIPEIVLAVDRIAQAQTHSYLEL
jgi:hypothetical protein